ncbi:rho GTPase-activating protein 20 [Pimephales promelas]|uniref:rho GTPase-activating protein 20 n=1 Tax=Pimephales promelas TaxID=90988 RepID=UPI001955CB31|nr:rho GTPase-activating protein 20 [Pimephales promelas]
MEMSLKVSNSNSLQSTRSGPVTRPVEEKMMKSTIPRRKTTVIKSFSKTRQSDEYEACDASQNAVLLMEAHAHLTNGLQSRERLLLLFTDSLIIAKTKSLYLKLKDRVSLSDIWLASCVHCITDRKLTSKNSFVIGWPTINYVISFSSSETKERWLQALQWHTCRARQRVLPNAILLYVLLICHPDDNSSETVAVAVDVSTTAENVVQYIMQQCKLLGEVLDYQLCVNYEKEQETYPLIGHELPFFILHHSLRSQQDHLLMPNEPVQETFSSAQQTASSKTPHFTLKTRTPTPRGALLKHKRKRSLIDWALRRGHFHQSDGQSDPQTASHKLFGQSLSSICPDGNLPKPIMDLLYLLFCEGPDTRGIFRRSANAKNCRILKERMNSGQSISLHEQSVFVSASLIMEFLRKLPGSVLCCDLYDDWMEVLESEDRYNKVRSLLAQLPEKNVTLLCHLFGVLHRIHTHSEVNQMTATNLALCIAPNMLWRSSQISPEKEGQSVLQVAMLIQYLIENSPAIFGDDLDSLFTRQMNSEQETHDYTDASFNLQHSSSEDTDQDFTVSSQLPEVHPLYLPLAALSLKEKRSPRPFQTDMPSTEGAYSCGTLDSISSRSSASVSMLGVGDLSQSRDRCLSEPSMYFSTPQTLAPTHTSVIRQSSYDASVIDSRNEQSQGPMGLSPEQQPHNSGMGTRRRRYTFWKSPQIPTRFRHPAQRLASMSSLSSTTTSSLSSLDSTLSLSSADPIPSTQDTQSRPFLFGAAARLQPLTPEMCRKRWTSSFTYEEEEDMWRERDQETENEKEREFEASFHDCYGEKVVKDGERPEGENGMSCESFGDVHEVKGATRQSVSMCSMEISVNPSQPSSTYQIEPNLDIDSQAISLNPCSVWSTPLTNQVGNDIQESQVTQTLTHTATTTQKQSRTNGENSVSRQQQERKKNACSNIYSSGRQKVSRMKITVFPFAGRVMLKHSKVTDQTTNMPMEAEQKVEPGFSVEKEGKVRESVQVHIPQTLFYGHNVPLVLLSTPPQQMSVQVSTHCTPPDDIGLTDAGLCDEANVRIVATDISNGVSSYQAENTMQNIKCISPSMSTVDDLHSPGCVTEPASPAVSIRSGHNFNQSIKLIHSNANQSVAYPKASRKSSGTFRHTICIKLPGSRGMAQNKPLP